MKSFLKKLWTVIYACLAMAMITVVLGSGWLLVKTSLWFLIIAIPATMLIWWCNYTIVDYIIYKIDEINREEWTL